MINHDDNAHFIDDDSPFSQQVRQIVIVPHGQSLPEPQDTGE